jgi:hypothetical protein
LKTGIYFSELNNGSPLSLYRQVKCEWGNGGYIVKCTENEGKEFYGGKQVFGNQGGLGGVWRKEIKLLGNYLFKDKCK